MKAIARFVRNLRISMICSALSSVAVSFSMADVDDSQEFVLILLASLLFWGGLIAEQVFMWKANALRKSIEADLSGRKIHGLPGVCSFCKTAIGFSADALLVLSVMVYAVLAIGNWGTAVAQYIFLFLIVLSFRIHCIANGKNYRYKVHLSRRRG